MGGTTPNTHAFQAAVDMLVVDDHDLVRLGLRTLVQSHALSCGTTMQVHEARSIHDALRLYRDHEGEIRLVMLDLHLPDAHGLSGLTSFKELFPSAHVVILSGESDPALIREAKSRGACAYLTKSADLQQVLDYVRSLSLLGNVTTGTTAPPDPDEQTPPAEDSHYTRIVRTAAGDTLRLTARQAQVLDWILSGLSNRQIAETAHLSEGTVKNHVSTLLLLFGVRSRAQLISQLR